MVVLALILLVLVAVLVVAIVVSNPQTYDLSIFGAVIPATSAGIFITGAVTMAVTILALLLLRTGIRRARARRSKLKELEAADAAATSSASATTNDTTSDTGTSATSATTKTSEAETSKGKSALDAGGQSSTTTAERQAMLDEADKLTRDEPQKWDSLASSHRPGMGLRSDSSGQLRNARTRRHRDPHGNHEVDRIAHQVTTLHSGTVLPSSLPYLGTGVVALLKCRCAA
jgi:hypothetical protein